MNYEEEQRNELEALREIYFNEIEVLSEEPPISLTIRIRTRAYSDPHCAGDDSDGEGDEESDEEEDGAGEDNSDDYITIRFDLPAKYPDEKPNIRILSSNLDEDDLKHLERDLDRRVEESLGMVMILTLVSGIDEWFSKREEEDDDDEEPDIPKKVDLEVERVFEGTPVTVDTFTAWKRKFDAEMAPKAAAIRPDGKLTGRAMFECDKTLAESDLNFVEDLDQTELEALMQELSADDGDDNDEDDDDDFEVDSDEDDEEDNDDEDDC